MKAFLNEWSQGRTWPRESEPDTLAGTTQDFDVMCQRIAGMSMKEFAQAGLVVTVDSDALGERVNFVSDNALVTEQMNGLIAYRAAELNQLAGVTARQLCELHALKKTFRVIIEFIKPAV